MNKPKLWTKDFVISTFVNLFTYIVFYLLIVIGVDYARISFQASPSQAGMATGMFVIAALFGRLFAGRLIVMWGTKRMLYIGIIVFFAAMASYFAANSLMLFNLVRFIHGIGFAFASTAMSTAVAGIIPKERCGEGIGYYALSVAIAAAIGPFMGMYISQRGTYDMVLALCTILAGTNCLMMLLVKIPLIKVSPETMAEMKKIKMENFVEYKVLPIAMMGFLIGISYSSVIGFISSYAQYLDLMAAGSFFFVVYALCSLAVRPITGPLIDSKGENFVMYPCFVFFTIGLLFMSQASTAVILLTSSAFIGVGYGSFIPSVQTIAIKLVPAHRIGMATSTLFAIIDAGVGIGPFILGFMIPTIGFRSTYMCMAVLVVISTWVYYIVHGRKVDELAVA